MSSRSAAKSKSSAPGIVVQKQRANAYTMMLFVAFTALCIACFCMYSLMNNFYAMKTTPPASEKVPPAKPRGAATPDAGGQAPGDAAQPPAPGDAAQPPAPAVPAPAPADAAQPPAPAVPAPAPADAAQPAVPAPAPADAAKPADPAQPPAEKPAPEVDPFK